MEHFDLFLILIVTVSLTMIHADHLHDEYSEEEVAERSSWTGKTEEHSDEFADIETDDSDFLFSEEEHQDLEAEFDVENHYPADDSDVADDDEEDSMDDDWDHGVNDHSEDDNDDNDDDDNDHDTDDDRARIAEDIKVLYTSTDEELIGNGIMEQVEGEEFYEAVMEELRNSKNDSRMSFSDEGFDDDDDDDEDDDMSKYQDDHEEDDDDEIADISPNRFVQIYTRRAEQCHECQEAMTELRRYFNNRFNRLRMELSFVLNCKYIFHRHFHDRHHYMHPSHRGPHLRFPPGGPHYSPRGRYDDHKHHHFHHGGNYLIRLCQRIMAINARKMFNVTAFMLRNRATYACYKIDRTCIHRYNVEWMRAFDNNNASNIRQSSMFNFIKNRLRIYGKNLFEENHPVCRVCIRQVRNMRDKKFTHYQLYRIFKNRVCERRTLVQHARMCKLQLRLNYPYTINHLHRHHHVTAEVTCSILNLCPAIFDDSYDNGHFRPHPPNGPNGPNGVA